MGQSFLTHDEKTSQSPSPDLLQFSGVSNANRKYFGSLSSVKERSISGASSRSPLDLTDSEGNFNVASSPSISSCSPRSPAQLTQADLYNSLVPSPIPPGNVNRLRERFMDFDSGHKDSGGESEKIDVFKSREIEGETETDTISELNYHCTRRPVTTSPYLPTSRSFQRRGVGTLPRSRNSLYSLSPTSRNAIAARHRNSLPTPSTSIAYEKLDVIRSEDTLSDSFGRMTIGTPGHVGNFISETPLGRPRPRGRPYVPQPRSVIIRAGYLPVLQTVGVVPTCPNGANSSTSARAIGIDSIEQRQDNATSNSECFIASENIPKTSSRVKEDVRLATSSTSTKAPLDEHNASHVVTDTVVRDTSSFLDLLSFLTYLN